MPKETAAAIGESKRVSKRPSSPSTTKPMQHGSTRRADSAKGGVQISSHGVSLALSGDLLAICGDITIIVEIDEGLVEASGLKSRGVPVGTA